MPWKDMEKNWIYIAQWNKPIKYYMLYDSNFITFWKRQKYRGSKEVSVCQRFGKVEQGWVSEVLRIFRTVKLFCMTVCDRYKTLCTGETHRTVRDKEGTLALAPVAQWIECEPADQKIAGLIPSEGTHRGCGPGLQLGTRKQQPRIDFSLPLFLLPFPSL